MTGRPSSWSRSNSDKCASGSEVCWGQCIKYQKLTNTLRMTRKSEFWLAVVVVEWVGGGLLSALSQFLNFFHIFSWIFLLENLVVEWVGRGFLTFPPRFLSTSFSNFSFWIFGLANLVVEWVGGGLLSALSQFLKSHDIVSVQYPPQSLPARVI